MNMDLLAAFDFASIISLVTENIKPLLIGGGIVAAPVNAPGTPYTSLIQLLLTKIGIVKPTTPVVPHSPSSPIANLLPMLISFIQKLAVKPPIATVVTPPDPTTISSNPNELIAWLMNLINAPETTLKPTPHIDNPNISPVEVRWEHFTGCFQAMVDLYPDFDISAVSANGNTEVKKVARVVKP